LNKYREINLYLLLIAFVALFIQVVLSAFKWKYILTAERVFVPYKFLLKSYLIGNFFSLFLPTSFGGDIYRVYSLGKFNPDSFQNASSVLFDRITGLFALVTISILSYVTFFKSFISSNFLLVYILATLVFWIISSDGIIEILSKYKFKIIDFITKICSSFNKYRKDKSILLKSLAISFFFQSNIVLINKLYCVALGIDMDIRYLFMVIPLIYLTEAIPISINGLGVRDSAFVFFFLRAGYSSEEALALSILVITMRYFCVSILGGTLFLKIVFFDQKSENEKLIK
jgi:uncharacterized protein (TIRG00374 family)